METDILFRYLKQFYHLLLAEPHSFLLDTHIKFQFIIGLVDDNLIISGNDSVIDLSHICRFNVQI